MSFTPRTAQVLKEIAIQLDRVASDHDRRAPLHVLKDRLPELLKTVTEMAENQVGGAETAEDVIGHAAGPQNVFRIVDKLAIQTFVCQFEVDYDPVATLRQVADDLIGQLRQIGEDENGDARLPSMIERIQVGLNTLHDNEDLLLAAGNDAFASSHSLDASLALDWELAKDAFTFKRVLAKRLSFYELQQKSVGENRETVRAGLMQTHGVAEPEPVDAAPVEATPVAASLSAVAAPTWSPEVEAEVDELTAELEAAINNRPSK